MFVEFPATRWSLIARLPHQPQMASALLSLYADAIGTYVATRLAGERVDRIEDVVQDVLVHLLDRPDVLAKAQPGTGSKFRYYLMFLAWQSAQNVLRYHRQREHASMDALAVPAAIDPAVAPTIDQAAAMDRAWAISLVHQAWDDVRAASRDGRLEPDASTLLEEHMMRGRPLRALAADAGISLATCSRRLARARHHLQQAIVERLRVAGEVVDGEDAAVAGDRLLDLLKSR